MTPAARAKELGLDNLQSLIDYIGVNRSVLRMWVKNKPKLFDLLVVGFVDRKHSQYYVSINDKNS